MKRIIAMLICGMFVFSAYAQKVFTLKSPSGKLGAPDKPCGVLCRC